MTYLLRLSAYLFLCVSLNSFAALSIRDLDGDWSNGHEGVYDDVLDITWLADANYAQTSGFSPHGNLTQTEASSFLNNVMNNGEGYNGFNNWRLTGSNGMTSYLFHWSLYNVTTDNSNELIFQHHQNFSSDRYKSFSAGSNGSNISLFENIQGQPYWTSGSGVVFNFGNGLQFHTNTYFNYSVWPVHDGDIFFEPSPVPLPAGIYLFLSGLVGLGLMRGRNA